MKSEVPVIKVDQDIGSISHENNAPLWRSDDDVRRLLQENILIERQIIDNLIDDNNRLTLLLNQLVPEQVVSEQGKVRKTNKRIKREILKNRLDINRSSSILAKLNIKDETPPEASRPIDIDHSVQIPFVKNLLIDIERPKRVAAIIHIYYWELAPEFKFYLGNFPGELDVYISTCNQKSAGAIKKIFADWKKGKVDVVVVPNKGRDVAPKIITFKQVYKEYEFVLCIHGKRSKHADVLSQWRHFLLENLIGDEETVKSIFTMFDLFKDLGMISPQHYEPMRHWTNWGGNFDQAESLASRMNIQLKKKYPLDFPSGSMFWARTAALLPIVDLDLTYDDFPSEKGQKDATLAHSIERLFFYVCEIAGYKWLKVAKKGFYEQTPAVNKPSTREGVEKFYKDKCFSLLFPGEVKIRDKRPIPVPNSPDCITKSLQNKFMGVNKRGYKEFKVVFGVVTYNNCERQINKCIKSLRVTEKVSGLKQNVEILILDNGKKSSIDPVYEVKVLAGGGVNLGFGAGHNRLMKEAFENDATVYIAINPDGMAHPQMLSSVLKMVEANNLNILVEGMQFPVEHPKIYDRDTFDTPWASGACLAVPKRVYEKIGGFDESFFMYCEDVDLSWRARINGVSVKTNPNALFFHPVTNRTQSVETLSMIYSSVYKLAHKWNAPHAYFSWLEQELYENNIKKPDLLPVARDLNDALVADFDNHTVFGDKRW